MIALGAICIAVAAASLALAFGPLPRGVTHVVPLITRVREEIAARHGDGPAARCTLALMQSVHAALRSGLPLARALRIAVADLDVSARTPFERALRSFDLGARLDISLRSAAKAARDRRVALALEALSLVADEQLAASRSAAVIASVADRLAFDERLSDEVRARTSGLRAQILLLALVVPAIALYLAFTLPGLAATLATPLGLRVLVPGAIAFEVGGIVASRRIVRGLTA
jgi:Flp pilus assembly protein TadB